jgi:hypothetical protein
MKKARIMLSGIAVLAVVGGALAFNAKKLEDKNVFCLLPDGSCPAVSYKTIPPGTPETTEPCGAGITTYFTTQPCTQTVSGTVYFTNVD